ncbi:MAG: ATP-binding protein, partial [Candidatus Omnitrophota bacterium]
FEFGRQIFRLSSLNPSSLRVKIARYLPWWLTWLLGIFILVFGLVSSNPWKTINIWSRYLLCFPAGVLAAAGLSSYYMGQKDILGPLKVRKYFFIASLVLLIYSILSGLVVPKGTPVLSHWVNVDSFFLAAHIPVQVFRALCALVAAWAIIGILRIFKWESMERLQIKVAERTQELTKTNELLKVEIAERGQREEEIRRNYEMQGVLNRLLFVSLQDISLEEMLNQFIEQITSISWLALESKGSISLVEDDPGVLVMKAQKGLSEPVKNMCGRVPFGRCCCGLAAKSGEIIFSDHLDERHENRYEGMREHGHYCVPIISVNKKVLGVVNLYIQQGWHRDESEKGFLIAIANVLAGVIERKKTDESLKAAYTSLQETQGQLIQAEKLTALGELASGVAHEVRNPLGIILQGVNYLENRISAKEDDIVETLAMLKDSVNRADKIINGLLDFSRFTTLNLQPEEINSILESSLVLVKSQFKLEYIEIVRELKSDLPRVLADKNKLEQVFVNLFLNAIQAMPEGGKIIIRSYEKQLAEAKNGIGKLLRENFHAGEQVVIVELEDTGIGILEENMKKIFDPFFTTKGPKSGTGLGLSVSRNIIQMHKGLIYAESQVGKGSKITVVLKTSGRG